MSARNERSPVGLVSASSTDETLHLSNFDIRNSTKAYLSALESPFDCK
jgi:hypothetical protein